MTTERMRTILAERYPGPAWRQKCLLMPERRVIAIYKSLERRGNLKKKPKKKEPGVKKAVQLSIFDLPEMKGELYANLQKESC